MGVHARLSSHRAAAACRPVTRAGCRQALAVKHAPAQPGPPVHQAVAPPRALLGGRQAQPAGAPRPAAQQPAPLRWPSNKPSPATGSRFPTGKSQPFPGSWRSVRGMPRALGLQQALLNPQSLPQFALPSN